MTLGAAFGSPTGGAVGRHDSGPPRSAAAGSLGREGSRRRVRSRPARQSRCDRSGSTGARRGVGRPAVPRRAGRRGRPRRTCRRADGHRRAPDCLVVRPAAPGAAAGDAVRLPVGGAPRGRGAPREPGAPAAGGGVRRRDPRDRDRAGVRRRALRHHPVQRAHGPAHPADDGRGAAARARCADHAAAAVRARRRPAALDPARAAQPRRSRPHVPGRGVGALRRGDVGEPLLAAVRRGARASAHPPGRAPDLPVGGAALLVAGGRGRPRAVAPAAPAADPLCLPPDAAEHVPGAGDLQRGRAAVRALRDARPAAGSPRWTTSAWPAG